MKTFPSALLFLGLACSGCAGVHSGPAHVPARANPEVTLLWQIDTPQFTASGGDIDDASSRVTLVFQGLDIPPVVAVRASGRCSALELANGPQRDLCASTAPPGTITSIACGPDPHVDRVSCAHVVRAPNLIAVWAVEIDVPVEDNRPPSPRVVSRQIVASVPLGPGTRVAVSRRIEYRSVEGE